MKKNLMNIGLESYQTPEGDVALIANDAVVVENTTPTVEIPADAGVTQDLERVRLIADAIHGMVPDSLGSRVANIGIAVMGDGDVVGASMEAFSMANVMRSVSVILEKIMRFLKKVAAVGAEFISRQVKQVIYGRSNAVALLKQATNMAKLNGGHVFSVKGAGLQLLQFGGQDAKLASDLVRNFEAFRRSVHEPYAKWVSDIIDIAGAVESDLKKIGNYKTITDAPADVFTHLEGIKLAQPPKDWKAVSGAGIAKFKPSTPTWGSAEILSFGTDKDTVLSLDGSEANFIRPENVDQETELDVNGDMIANYAKMAVGVTDLLVGMSGPADELNKIFASLNQLNFKMQAGAGMNDGDNQLYAELMRRVELVGRAATSIEVITRQTAEYFQYLVMLRGILFELVQNAIASAPKA